MSSTLRLPSGRRRPAAQAAFSGRGTGRSPLGRASAPVSGIGRRIPCAAPSVNFRPKKSGNPHDDRYSSGNLQFGAVSGGSAGFHSGAGGPRLAAPDPGRRLLGRDRSDSGGVPPAESGPDFPAAGRTGFGQRELRGAYGGCRCGADHVLRPRRPVAAGQGGAQPRRIRKTGGEAAGRNSAAPVHRSAGRR